MKFEEKLVQLRKEHKLSQEQLAEKLGVSRQAVSRWESGETTPDMVNLLGLCNIFDVSADYLLRDEKSEAQTTAPTAEIVNRALSHQRKQILRLVAVAFSQAATIIAAFGLALSNSTLQSILAALCICFFSGMTGYQSVRYGKG